MVDWQRWRRYATSSWNSNIHISERVTCLNTNAQPFVLFCVEIWCCLFLVSHTLLFIFFSYHRLQTISTSLCSYEHISSDDLYHTASPSKFATFPASPLSTPFLSITRLSSIVIDKSVPNRVVFRIIKLTDIEIRNNRSRSSILFILPFFFFSSHHLGRREVCRSFLGIVGQGEQGGDFAICFVTYRSDYHS
jgi:hypothetical protein